MIDRIVLKGDAIEVDNIMRKILFHHYILNYIFLHKLKLCNHITCVLFLLQLQFTNKLIIHHISRLSLLKIAYLLVQHISFHNDVSNSYYVLPYSI